MFTLLAIAMCFSMVVAFLLIRRLQDKPWTQQGIIEGSQERETGIIQIKDLIAGKQAAQAITDNAEWKAARPGQFEVKREDLVSAIQNLLSEQ